MPRALSDWQAKAQTELSAYGIMNALIYRRLRRKDAFIESYCDKLV